MESKIFKEMIDAFNVLEAMHPKPRVSEFKDALISIIGKDKVEKFEKENGEIIQMVIWGRVAESRAIDFDMYSIEISQTPHIDKGTFILIGKNASLFNPSVSQPWITEGFMKLDKADKPSNFIPFEFRPTPK